MGGGDHEARLKSELVQLSKDIKRLGERNEEGKYVVKLGVLFDDESGQNFYEALVGTLKAAKKRGQIDFKGQMLLKGAHDAVDITLLQDTDPDAAS